MESYKGNLFTIKACYRRSQNGSTATDSQSIMNGNLTFENTFLYFSKLRGIQLIYLMKKTYLILHYKFLEDADPPTISIIFLTLNVSYFRTFNV